MTPHNDDLIGDAMRAQRQIAHALHAAADPTWLHLDLTMGQVKALFVLADDALTVGQLAGVLGIGKPAASILVERLVQLQLATRQEDPLDRRRTLVRLSPMGDDLASRLRQGGQDRVRVLLGQLDQDDLAALVRGLQALARVAGAPGESVAASA